MKYRQLCCKKLSKNFDLDESQKDITIRIIVGRNDNDSINNNDLRSDNDNYDNRPNHDYGCGPNHHYNSRSNHYYRY